MNKRTKHIIVDVDLIHSSVEQAHTLAKNHEPESVKQLRSCSATVYTYNVDGFVVHLLKSYNTFVAMVDEYGDGYDFLRFVYGYTATSAQHIAKFFDDYANYYADIFTYKP